MKRIEHTENNEFISLQVCDLLLLRIMRMRVPIMLYTLTNYYYNQFKKDYRQKNNLNILFEYVRIPNECESLLRVLNDTFKISARSRNKILHKKQEKHQNLKEALELEKIKYYGILNEQTYISLSSEEKNRYWKDYQKMLEDCANRTHPLLNTVKSAPTNSVTVKVPIPFQEDMKVPVQELSELFKLGVKEATRTIETPFLKSTRLEIIRDGFNQYFRSDDDQLNKNVQFGTVPISIDTQDQSLKNQTDSNQAIHLETKVFIYTAQNRQIGPL